MLHSLIGVVSTFFLWFLLTIAVVKDDQEQAMKHTIAIMTWVLVTGCGILSPVLCELKYFLKFKGWGGLCIQQSIYTIYSKFHAQFCRIVVLWLL